MLVGKPALSHEGPCLCDDEALPGAWAVVKAAPGTHISLVFPRPLGWMA